MTTVASLNVEIGANVNDALRGIKNVNTALEKLTKQQTDLTLNVDLQFKSGSLQKMSRALKTTISTLEQTATVNVDVGLKTGATKTLGADLANQVRKISVPKLVVPITTNPGSVQSTLTPGPSVSTPGAPTTRTAAPPALPTRDTNFDQDMARFRANTLSFQKQLNQSVKMVADSNLKALQSTSGITQALQKATDGTGALNRSARESTSIFGRLGTQVASVATGMLAFQAVQSTFSALNGAVIGYNDTLDKARLTFTAAMDGNSKAADKLISQMETLAATTPFEFKDLLPLSAKLLDAGRNAKTLITDMRSIGDYVARIGEGKEFIDRIVYALNQISTAGKVAGTEIRQLTEARVPAIKILSQAFGTTTAEMQKMVSDGLVPGNKAVEALIRGMGKLGFGFMAKQSQTLTGQLSNLWDMFNRGVGTALRPAYDGFSKVLSITVELGKNRDIQLWLVDLQGKFKTAFSFAVGAVQGLWDVFKRVAPYVGGALAGMGIYATGMAAAWTFAFAKTIPAAISKTIAALLALRLTTLGVFAAIGIGVVAAIKGFFALGTWLGKMLDKMPAKIKKFIGMEGFADAFKSLENDFKNGFKSLKKDIVEQGMSLFDGLFPDMSRWTRGWKKAVKVAQGEIQTISTGPAPTPSQFGPGDLMSGKDGKGKGGAGSSTRKRNRFGLFGPQAGDIASMRYNEDQRRFKEAQRRITLLKPYDVRKLPPAEPNAFALPAASQRVPLASMHPKTSMKTSALEIARTRLEMIQFLKVRDQFDGGFADFQKHLAQKARETANAARELIEGQAKAYGDANQALQDRINLLGHEAAMIAQGVDERTRARKLEVLAYKQDLAKNPDLTPQARENLLAKKVLEVAAAAKAQGLAELPGILHNISDGFNQAGAAASQAFGAMFDQATTERNKNAMDGLFGSLSSLGDSIAASVGDASTHLEAMGKRAQDLREYLTDVQNRLNLLKVPEGIARELLNIRQQLKRDNWKGPEIEEAVNAARIGLEAEKAHGKLLDFKDRVSGLFTDMFSNLDKGFKGFFQGILSGVVNLLNEMAVKILAAQATKALMNMLGMATGAAMGGSGSATGEIAAGGNAAGTDFGAAASSVFTMSPKVMSNAALVVAGSGSSGGSTRGPSPSGPAQIYIATQNINGIREANKVPEAMRRESTRVAQSEIDRAVAMRSTRGRSRF